MAESKLGKANEKVAEGVTAAFQKMEAAAKAEAEKRAANS